MRVWQIIDVWQDIWLKIKGLALETVWEATGTFFPVLPVLSGVPSL